MSADEEFYICVKPYGPENSSGFIKLEKGDIIKLNTKVDNNQAKGINLRTSEHGYFLFSSVALKRLQSRESVSPESGFVSGRDNISTNRSQSPPDFNNDRFSNTNSTSSDGSSTNIPLLPHRILSCSVKVPLLCSFCNEFILYLTLSGKRCTVCSQIFHQPCYENIKLRRLMCSRSNNTSADSNSLKSCSADNATLALMDSDRVRSAISASRISPKEWDNLNVLQWLTTVNLSRFIDVFRYYQYNGDDLLSISNSSFPSDQSHEYNHIPAHVRDPLHRWMISLAASQLFDKEPSPYNDSSFRSPNSDGLSNRNSDSSMVSQNSQSHHFVQTTILSKVTCHYCNTFFIGTEHQGVKCCHCELLYHRICSELDSLIPCHKYQANHDCALSCYTKTFFGVPLEYQPRANSNNVPLFLQACIDAFEHLIKGRTADEVADFYKSSSTCHEMSSLIREVDSLLIQMNYDECDENCQKHLYDQLFKHMCAIGTSNVMKLMKFYLRDLPDSVWPTALYTDAMKIIRDNSGNRSNRSEELVKSAIKELPQSSYSTLIFLISHYKRMQDLDSNSSNSGKTKTVWYTVFWNILLRIPRLEQPLYIDKLYRDYQLLLLEIITKVCMNVLSGDSTIGRTNSGISVSSLDSSLSHCEWYWGDIGKEEVAVIMADQPDGSFLVRESTQGRGYTLAVKNCGEIKLLRIYHENDCFDIYNPPVQFNSVKELIERYLNNSDHKLSFELKSPISKNTFLGAQNKLRDFSSNQLIDELEKTEKMTSEKSDELENLLSDYQKKHVILEEKTRQIKVHEKIEIWLTNQFKLLIENNQQALNDQESDGIKSHGKLVKGRIEETLGKIEFIKNESKQLVIVTRNLLERINSIHPELKRHTKLQQQITLMLRERGAPSYLFNSVDNLVLEKIRLSLNESAPINLKSSWFCDLSREASDKILMQPTVLKATFLIRPASTPEYFAMAVKVGDAVKHIRIYVDSGKYGLVQGHCTFNSLRSLVFFYHFNSLVHHNEEMATTLKYPVNVAPELIDQYYGQFTGL